MAELQNIEIDSNEQQVSNKKAKDDKRSITSRLNLEKARNARLQQIKEQKEVEKYTFDVDNDESSDDSDYEEIIIKPKRRQNNGGSKNAMREELEELRSMMYQLVQKNNKPKKQKPKVVQVIKEREVLPPQPPQPAQQVQQKAKDPQLEEMLKVFLGPKY